MSARRYLLQGALAIAFAIGCRAAQAIEVSSFDIVGDDAQVEDVLKGTYDAQFRLSDGGQASLGGGLNRTHWLRIGLDPLAPDASPGILRLDRVPLNRVTVYMPQAAGRLELSDGFFAPGSDGLSPHSYGFALTPAAHKAREVYVVVRAGAAASVTPQVLDERTFHARERALAGLSGALEATLIVLLLSALSLYVALRDRAYLDFGVLVGATLVWLLALDGALYRWGATAWFGWWGDFGLSALALACCGLALRFSQSVFEATEEHRSHWTARVPLVLLALAVLCLVRVPALLPWVQMGVGALTLATALWIAAIGFAAARRDVPLARAYGLLWLLLGVALAARAAQAQGWLAQHPFVLHALPLVAVVCLVLVSTGLAYRVLAFRRQRDQAQELRERTDANLQLEQARRQFADGLRERLRVTKPGDDLLWLAFKQVLSGLRQLLPQQSSTVAAFGYQGRDVLLCEPLDAKEHYTQLLQARNARLRNLCRARKPMSVPLDEGEAAANYAVVPMNVTPGWGVLLIERPPGAEFGPDELRLASEFLAQAVDAAEQAAGQAALLRQAEIDPLTGVHNRNAGEALLEAVLRRALANRLPMFVLMINPDQLAQINERYSPSVGDECLKRAAEAIRGALSEEDPVVRWGEDSFLVALSGQTPEQTRQIAERIRLAASQVRIEGTQPPLRFTVSIGVAGRLPGDERAQGIVERAERALQTAKKSGRNQVQVSQSRGFGSSEDPQITL